MDSLIRFEHRRQKVAGRPVFYRRLGKNLAVAVAMLAVSLGIGMAGFVVFEGKDWLEAYDNAAMILSGMGPFDMAVSAAGKVFEGTYAIYSGLVVLLITGLVLAPVFHRVLHSFHVEDEDEEKREERSHGKKK